MADAEMNTRAACGAAASASAKLRVPCIRLSRTRRFLVSVQRPTMDSPARCITASKPDTDSGASGRDGPHAISLLPDAAPRTMRVTWYPFDCNAGSSAEPMSPEAPLTKTLADINKLYQFLRFAGQPSHVPKALETLLATSNSRL